MTGPTRPGDALSDTQRRFLAAVMERLPRELVHEIYLFAPMKQGGVETGIAVFAMDEAHPLEVELATTEQVGIDESGDDQTEGEQTEGEQTEVEQTEVEQPEVELAEAALSDVQAAPVELQDAGGAAVLETVGEADLSTVLDRPLRYTVHTARYRLQLKGPERGRWDVDVVEEADAPLVSVDAVVRGVHRRSGEPSEVERLAPHDLARALGEIPWTSEN